ncbi:MAG TPA: trypsin-like peptidase domain-containing protein [Dehalococcoidia bacterium]|nr:trypsin-like peptidase domain-containing protein [Dehalococcoidia bacterium]
MKVWRYTTAFLVGAAFAGVLAVSIVAVSGDSNQSPDTDTFAELTNPPASETPSETNDGSVLNLDGECLSAADIYQEVRPSVVEIHVAITTQTGFGTQQSTATGTGFVIDDEGHILTNNHVVADAQEISVLFDDGDVVDAVLLGTDPANDLAVIQVNTSDHEVDPVELGDSDDLRVGDPVLAIGNPFSLQGTLTQGIVSALERTYSTGVSTRPIRDMIQTDAAINPGNSGGPLINCRGEIIGVNTLLENPTGDRVNVGVGFAVSINTAISRLDDLKSGAEIDHAWLGIAGLDISPALARGLGLAVDDGVYITLVTPSSPAAAAGLVGAFSDEIDAQTAEDPPPGGDVIIAADGISVTGIDQLATYLDQEHDPGDTVELTVVRDGQEIAVRATLSDWPE